MVGAEVLALGGLAAVGGVVGLVIGRRGGAGTQLRLLETEARSAAIVDAAVDGIITINERGHVESMNRAAESIFGYAAAEVMGRNVSMLMPQPYRSEHDSYLGNYISTGQARIIGIGREVVGQRKDGTTFPMDLAVGESRLAGRRIFAGIIRDITQRKQTEDSLRVSEERFRVMVEGIHDYSIALIDANGAIVSWNPGAERLYGWSAAEMVGNDASRLYPLEAIESGEPDRALAVARTDGRFEEEGWRQRKDGSRLWVHVTIWSLRDGAGSLRGYTRISRDITAHKRHEDDLRRAKDEAERAKDDAELAQQSAEHARAEAERANVSKTRFLAAASHDLRQPVQAIFFFVSVLAHKLRGHAAQSILDDLQTSLEGLNILLDSLLDVSKLDAGLVAPKETDFSVSAILDRLAAEFKPLAADKGLGLRMVGSSTIIRSDPALLSRIVQNLVANAIRYTPRGRILLGCRRRGETLRIEVWDTGIGIPADRTRDIFDEFTQLGNPERDRNQGLGLGLAIVDRLARLLGHSVDLRSRPGKGSMFAVTVPVGGLAMVGHHRPDNVQLPPEASRRLVVLIDDEAIVLKGLSMVLQAWGYEVIAASSEADAIEQLAISKRTPSLILADYRLREGRTGTEAVMKIRELFSVMIPSIIITGDTAPERLREAEASGLSILHKPVQPPTLREVLRDTLDGQTLH
jgi:two-component system, sensor histidine kinase